MFYKYNINTGEYLGETQEAFYTLDGKLVAGYTTIKPSITDIPEGKKLVFKNNEWSLLDDYRGTWENIDADTITINELGKTPPEGYAKKVNDQWFYADGTEATDIELKHLKAQKKTEIETAYQNALSQPINYTVNNETHTFQADQHSQDILTKVIVGAPSDFTTNWLDINNVPIQMTLTDLKGLAQAILQRGEQLFQKKVQLKQQLAQATTKEEVEAIQWAE